MLYRASLPLLIALAACGGGDSGNPADANTQSDAGPPSVRTVACPPGVVPTVSTTELNQNSFNPPSVSISVGGIVKFAMSPSHNVGPNPIRNPDRGLVVGMGATACLEFDKAGTFGFICMAHGFAGTVVVQ